MRLINLMRKLVQAVSNDVNKVEPTKEERAAVKQLSREYRSMKDYITFIRRKRPTLLNKQAKVSLDEYEEKGIVTYAERVALFPQEDIAVIEAYVRCLKGVYCLERGIMGIEDAATRKVAEETLLNRKSCETLAAEMGVTRRAVSYRKRDAENILVRFMNQFQMNG